MTGLNMVFVSVDIGHDPASRIQNPNDIAPISVKTEKSPQREHTSHPKIQKSNLTTVNELHIYLYHKIHTQQRNARNFH